MTATKLKKKREAKPAKPTCLMIQWEGLHQKDGKPTCPKCGEPAEMVLGVFGNPCWAHK